MTSSDVLRATERASAPGILTRREIGALLAIFLLTLPAVTARLYSSDEVQYYAYLRSLWFDRDVSFDNEYRHFYERGVARTPGFAATFLETRTPTGLRENFGTLGSAILWAPFYGIADVATRALRAAGRDLPADGFSTPYIASVAYGSAVYGFLALLLSMAAARRLVGPPGASVVAGLAVWFGTPLLFYMYAAPPFAHAPSAFAVALFVTVWLRVRERWTPAGLAALGASAALMTMVREQDVFYALGPAVDFLLAWAGARRAGRGSVALWAGSAAVGLTAFVLIYLPQLLAYLSLNGRFGPSTLVTRKMTWTSPHAPGVLASPHHGLFAWTPLAAIAVAGLVWLWLRARAPGGQTGGSRGDPARSDLAGSVADPRRVAGLMLLMLALQVYVSGSVESWTVAGAFGQRRFVGATILMVIGLAGFWRAMPAGLPRTAAALVLALGVWWNMGLMALFGSGLMDRQRLHLAQNARDVFITLPRLAPELAFRYFTARESFYKPPE